MKSEVKAAIGILAWVVGFLWAAIANNMGASLLIFVAPFIWYIGGAMLHSIKETGVVKTVLKPVNALTRSIGGRKISEITVKMSGDKPRVIFPHKLWADHMKMTDLVGRKEFATLLRIENEEDNVYRVTDYFVPYQEAAYASVKFPIKDTMTDFLRTHGEAGIENWYGVLHLHPWKGATVGMSGIDTAQMWDWVKPVGRGVYIVMNSNYATQCVLVTTLLNGVHVQIPMDFEVEYPRGEVDAVALKALLDEKLKSYVYGGGFNRKPYKPYVTEFEVVTPYPCPHCSKPCTKELAHYCYECGDWINYRDIPRRKRVKTPAV